MLEWMFDREKIAAIQWDGEAGIDAPALHS